MLIKMGRVVAPITYYAHVSDKERNPTPEREREVNVETSKSSLPSVRLFNAVRPDMAKFCHFLAKF